MPSFTEWKDAYVEGLDAVLIAESQVSEFNAAGVEFLGGRTVKYRKLSFGSGTAPYSRFASADDDFTYSYETRELENDREKTFYLDWSDANDFPVDDASEITSEFIRLKVVPEQDANFITKVVAEVPTANKITTAPAANNIKGQIDAAIAQLADAGVPKGTLFMNAATKLLFEGTLNRTYTSETGVSTQVFEYNGWIVKQLPANIIGTARYLFIGGGCAQNIVKHVYNQAFAPGQHTNGDGWLLQYRVIYDAIVLDNKTVGLYVNAPAAG
jgi:hypothetical protein